MSAEKAKESDKTALYLREDMTALRRDVLDIRDTVALRAERSASHLAVQTTLMVVSLIVVLAAAVFSFLAATRAKESGDGISAAVEKLKDEMARMSGQYASAVSELERVKAQRDKVSNELAAARRELAEMRLQLANRRYAGEQETDSLQRKIRELSDRCSALEREADRAAALAAQLEALRRDSESKMKRYEETIAELQRKLKAALAQPRVLPTAAGTPVKNAATGPLPSSKPSPTPRKSISPKDIKKKKEREFEKL